MTDDLDPALQLSSAALDNEVTADERAHVEASSELRAELEMYREIREEVRAVEVPPAARESALAAAFAAFDSMAAEGGPAAVDPGVGTFPSADHPPVARVISLQARRARQMRWLGGAAAAAVVAVFAIAVARSAGGEDSKSSSATVPAVTAAKSAAPTAPQPELAADTASAAGGATAATTAETSAIASAELPAAATDESTAASSADTVPDPWASAESIVTQQQLIAFAMKIPSTLLATSASTTVPPSTAAPADTAANTAGTVTVSSDAGTIGDTYETFPDADAYAACVARTLLPAAPAVYENARVIIERDDVAGRVIVVDPSTCTILVIVPIAAP